MNRTHEQEGVARRRVTPTWVWLALLSLVNLGVVGVVAVRLGTDDATRVYARDRLSELTPSERTTVEIFRRTSPGVVNVHNLSYLFLRGSAHALGTRCVRIEECPSACRR